MVGNLAYSLAGHDKNQIYIIIKEEDEYVYLCEGRLKPFDSPKKKNKKHIQVINKGVDAELSNRIKEGGSVRDEEIKRIIKLYGQKQSKQI